MFYAETKQRQWYLKEVWNTSKFLFELGEIEIQSYFTNLTT